MANWIVPLDVLAQRRGGDDPRQVGGKAGRLAWLVRQGFSVPEGWVIPQTAFAELVRSLPPGCEPKALLRAAAGRVGYERAAEARTAIISATLPSGLRTELDALWSANETRMPWGLAVRSSATCEDGALVSMAGLAETVLGVRDRDALEAAVRTVWASLASGRALAYLAAHGVRDVGMAVVIQRVIEAEAAGVMFTRAPGRAQAERIINASVGLGTAIVSGHVTPDALRIDPRGRVLESAIAHKERAVVIGASGVEERPISEPDAPALSDARVRDLAEVALRLEKLEAVAWDVEFACDRERTWVVQARPVTGRGLPEGGEFDTVWSNANVGEALPGVATPLTWSVAGAFSETGFRRAFSALGCKVPKSAKLVGNIYGRVYLNLTEFMRIAAQVPFLDPRTLVELGGGGGGEELATQVEGVSRRGFYARLPMTASRLVKEQLRLDADVLAYEAIAEKAYHAHLALDLAILPDDALARTIRDIQSLLERTGTVMLTCASSMLGTHLALKMLLERWDPFGAERVAQSLTSGIRDLESSRPALGMMHLANVARSDPEARLAIENEQTATLDAIPEGPTRRALTTFLELYGDRAVREAELSTPRWREDIGPVLKMLRVTLRGEMASVDDPLLRAKSQADAEMAKLIPKLGFVEQSALRHLVVRAQKAARLRERTRAWVTRVLGMLRSAAVEANRRLFKRDPELRKEEESVAESGASFARIESVFFLTLEELVTTLRSDKSDLVPIVRARRAEYARDLARPDPPATFIGAPPPVVLPAASGDVLRGLPASSGVVEGNARVLHDSSDMGDLRPGEILVVHSTDVGWTPLFLLAAGVVTELGGPLSHAAIVAREFGVPSVVNVQGATRALRTGERIRLDGDRGTVERLR